MSTGREWLQQAEILVRLFSLVSGTVRVFNTEGS